MYAVRKISTINVARGNDHDLYYYIRAPSLARVSDLGGVIPPALLATIRKYIGGQEEEEEERKIKLSMTRLWILAIFGTRYIYIYICRKSFEKKFVKKFFRDIYIENSMIYIRSE